MIQPLCNAVDDVTGAVCTNEATHDGAHRDESDPGCILTFPGRTVAKVDKVILPADEEWMSIDELYYSGALYG